MKLDKFMRGIPSGVILAAGIAVIFTSAFLTALVGVDYPIHDGIVTSLDLSDFAALFREHMEPLWHLMTYGVMHLLRCRVEIAAGIVSGLLFVILFLIAFAALRKAVPSAPASAAALGSLLLHLSGAIYLPWFNAEPYLGQGSPNAWHNPTTIAVKPLALIVFLLAGAVLRKSSESQFAEKTPVWKYILIALLLALSNFAKPSFAQIFIPSTVLIMIIWLIVYQRKNLGVMAGMFIACIPSLAIMVVQFVLSFYSENKGASGIRIAPLEVAGLYTKSIPGSLLLALAFPLLILILDLAGKKARWDDIFAWIMLFTGLCAKLLLAESGERASHGNFSWGYLLGLYLVWFCAVRSLIRRGAEDTAAAASGTKKFDFGFWAGVILLVLHFLSGCYYVFIHMILRGNGL